MPTEPTYLQKGLLLKIADGDETAFAALYRLYVPQIIRTVKSITKNELVTEEVIQDTFTRLWINRTRLSEVEFPHTYILKTAAHVCITYLKKSAVRIRVAGQLAQTIPWFDSSMEAGLGLKELEKVIQAAIQELTPAQRNIYRLSREEGLKIPEIAERLEISPNTVKNTLVASLKIIREYVQKAGFTISFLVCWSIVENIF